MLAGGLYRQVAVWLSRYKGGCLCDLVQLDKLSTMEPLL